MKIVFFGTSKFAAAALKKLKESGHNVIACVTQPSRKSGRRLKITASPVSDEAESLKIPVLQPNNISEKDFILKLKSFEADFFVIVAFGKIVTKEILGMPRFCCLNIHASLLPKYRGAAPVKWAIINGEEKTGVTIMKVDEGLDTGDIVLQKEAVITKDDTAESLDAKLAEIGAGLLLEAIELIKDGKARFTGQNGKEATFAPKLTKEDGRIDWNSDTKSILDKIRGLRPWPGTYSFIEGRMLKIISAEAKRGVDTSRFLPGQVVISGEEEGFVVKTKDGSIAILELQLEGKKRLPAALFLRGHKVKTGARLG